MRMNRFVMVISCVLLVFSLIGCDKKDKEQSKQAQVQLNEMAKNPPKTQFSLVKAEAEVDYNNKDGKDYIVYKINFRNPQDTLSNFRIYVLAQPFNNSGRAYYFENSRDENVTLGPKNSKSYEVAFAANVIDEFIDDSFINNYRQVLIKIVWTSDDGKLHEEFQALEVTPTKKLLDFLDKF